MAKLFLCALSPQRKPGLLGSLPQISQLNWACLLSVAPLALCAISMRWVGEDGERRLSLTGPSFCISNCHAHIIRKSNTFTNIQGSPSSYVYEISIKHLHKITTLFCQERLKSENLNSNPCSVTYELCDLGQFLKVCI